MKESDSLQCGEGVIVKGQPCTVYLELDSVPGVKDTLSLRLLIPKPLLGLRYLTQGVVGQGRKWDLEPEVQGFVLALQTHDRRWKVEMSAL